jgi:hypothetical protein
MNHSRFYSCIQLCTGSYYRSVTDRSGLDVLKKTKDSFLCNMKYNMDLRYLKCGNVE